MGRGISHWNGREIRGEMSQVNIERDQQDRWEEEWSIPVSIERREDVLIRQESHRTPPTPSEDRLFTNWSSLDSPQARTITLECFCRGNRTKHKST